MTTKAFNVQHFVIASIPRSGGNMLQSALAAHPQILCAGEIFNRKQHPGAEHAPLAQIKARLKGDQPIQGFRLMSRQPTIAKRPGVLRAVRSLPNLKVVCLARRNLLRQAVSRAIADETGQWLLRAGVARRQTRVSIHPQALLRRLGELEQQRADNYADFFGTPMIRVEYEDLLDRYEPTLQGVLQFLGADDGVIPQPNTLRINPEPLADLVENWPAVRDAITATHFAWMVAAEEGGISTDATAA